jgi:hypothetical protein
VSSLRVFPGTRTGGNQSLDDSRGHALANEEGQGVAPPAFVSKGQRLVYNAGQADKSPAILDSAIQWHICLLFGIRRSFKGTSNVADCFLIADP